MDEDSNYTARQASSMPVVVLLIFALITLASLFVSTALFWTLFTVFIFYSVRVNGVVFYRVIDPAKATLRVHDYVYATSAIAQTTLRDVIGGVELDELLENRDTIAQEIRRIVDAKTDEWGIDITEIRLQDITLPDNMKRAMAVQAEAEREKRAVIIKAEGDLAAAENYAKAAAKLATTPGALTLRTLQTLSDLSKDPSQKFYFVVPLELLESWIEARKSAEKNKK